MAQVLNYHDAVMYDTDVGLFGEGGWLNDNCINWFFRVLEHEVFQGRTELLFMDPAVVACMMNQCDDPEEFVDLGRGLELGRRSMVFVPVNNARGRLSHGSHWSLLVFERGGKDGSVSGNSSSSNTRFRHFDSSEGSNRTSAERTAANFLRMFDGAAGEGDDPLRVEHVRDAPQQTNSFDCGMYTVLMAEGLASKTATPQPPSVASSEGIAVAPPPCKTRRPREDRAAVLSAEGAGVDSSGGDGREGMAAAAEEGSSGEEASAGGMVMISPEFVSSARILARERLSRCIRTQGWC